MRDGEMFVKKIIKWVFMKRGQNWRVGCVSKRWVFQLWQDREYRVYFCNGQHIWHYLNRLDATPICCSQTGYNKHNELLSKTDLGLTLRLFLVKGFLFQAHQFRSSSRSKCWGMCLVLTVWNADAWYCMMLSRFGCYEVMCINTLQSFGIYDVFCTFFFKLFQTELWSWP